MSEVGELFSNPTTPGTILLVLLVDEFGTEWFDWEAESLDYEIMSRWKVKMPVHNSDKVWALVTLLTTNQFYRNLDCFLHVCNALSNRGADFHNFDPADISDMAWALAETTLIDPPEKNDPTREFSDEIKHYMTLMLDHEGYSRAPKIIGKYASPSGDESALQPILEGDGIDYRAYWEDQERKRVSVDQYVSQRLAEILDLLSRLPLRHADQKALQELQQRASKALGAQQKEVERETETASPQIQL